MARDAEGVGVEEEALDGVGMWIGAVGEVMGVREVGVVEREMGVGVVVREREGGGVADRGAAAVISSSLVSKLFCPSVNT
jgi:hypothetical protein